MNNDSKIIYYNLEQKQLEAVGVRTIFFLSFTSEKGHTVNLDDVLLPKLQEKTCFTQIIQICTSLYLWQIKILCLPEWQNMASEWQLPLVTILRTGWLSVGDLFNTMKSIWVYLQCIKKKGETKTRPVKSGV